MKPLHPSLTRSTESKNIYIPVRVTKFNKKQKIRQLVIYKHYFLVSLEPKLVNAALLITGHCTCQVSRSNKRSKQILPNFQKHLAKIYALIRE